MHLQRPKGGGNGEDTTGESLPKQVTAKLSGFNEGEESFCCDKIIPEVIALCCYKN